MVFKPASWSVTRERTSKPLDPLPLLPGNLICLVERHIERLPCIDNSVLSYNLTDGRILVKMNQNEPQFDLYVGLPFTKGVTERKTGRTELIIGSSAHHIDAMQQQFAGVVWDEKQYGDSIRWINVGTTHSGFIGLDYNPQAKENAGVAKSLDDVQFLSRTLLAYGYEKQKKLFLLKPPYIQEQEQGKIYREQGLTTLGEYASR